MQQSNAWQSLGREVVIPEFLRTRTRTRRRRRKRSWGAPWAYLSQVFLGCRTCRMGRARFALAILVVSRSGGPAEHHCLIAYSH
jgi:hypothetical protein